MNQDLQKEYYQKNREKLRANQKKYYQENKERILEQTKKYRQENGEKIRDYEKEYREKNKEKMRAYKREYRRANPEKAREERKREYAKNPERILATNRKYQHSKKNPDLADGEFNMVEHFYEQATRLNNIFGGQVFEVDHTTPLSKGGKHCPWNLQVVPAKWNRTKNNHHAGLWEVPCGK